MTMNGTIEGVRRALAKRKMMTIVAVCLVSGILLGVIGGFILFHNNHNQTDLDQISALKTNQSEMISKYNNATNVIAVLQDENKQMAPDAQAYRQSGLGQVSTIAGNGLAATQQAAGNAWQNFTAPLVTFGQNLNQAVDKANNTLSTASDLAKATGIMK
jgi:predicted PurR-regulated permease PerM